MEPKTDLFVLREVEAADVPFIYNSWLKSYRDSPAVAGIPNTVYFTGHHDVITGLLAKSTVIVACNPDDVSQIYGYAVGAVAPAIGRPDTAVLHWVYVKHPFRGYGIARSLMNATVGKDDIVYTHRVKSSDRLVKSRKAVFNPYLLHK